MHTHPQPYAAFLKANPKWSVTPAYKPPLFTPRGSRREDSHQGSQTGVIESGRRDTVFPPVWLGEKQNFLQPEKGLKIGHFLNFHLWRPEKWNFVLFITIQSCKLNVVKNFAHSWMHCMMLASDLQATSALIRVQAELTETIGKFLRGECATAMTTRNRPLVGRRAAQKIWEFSCTKWHGGCKWNQNRSQPRKFNMIHPKSLVFDCKKWEKACKKACTSRNRIWQTCTIPQFLWLRFLRLVPEGKLPSWRIVESNRDYW